MWGAGRRQFVFAGIGVSILACAWPWWPAAASLWLALVVATTGWPPAKRWEEETPQYWKALDAKALRSELLRPKETMRLGLRPGCEMQDTANPPPGWLRPVSIQAGVSALAGVSAACVDAAVSGLLSNPVLRRLKIEQIGMDSGARMVWLTAIGSAVFGWCIAGAIGEIKRRALFRGEDGWQQWGLAPAAEMGGMKGLAEIATSKSFMVAVPCAVMALFLARWFNIPSIAIGWGPTIGVLACIAAAAAAVPVWKASAAEQHEMWHKVKWEERQWELRWIGAQGSTIDQNRVPVLEHVTDLPEDNPTHRQLLFRMRPGTEFSNFEKLVGKLGSSLGSSRVVLERYQRVRGEEALDGFRLSYQLPDADADWGSHPHLATQLDRESTEFALIWAVISAFRDLGLSTPMLIEVSKLSAEGAPPLHLTIWQLTGGVTYAQLAAKVPQLTELLGCEWCRPFTPPGFAYVGLAFGYNPEHTQLRNRAMKNKLEGWHWSWLLHTCGVVGSTGLAPVMCKTRPTWRGVTEWTFDYSPGLEYRLVQAKLEALKSLAGYGYIEIAKHPDHGKFILLTGDSDPLAQTHEFMSHKVLSPAVRGSPRTDWIVGITSAGELYEYSWDGEEPHLLIAGSSGSGKSGIVNALLCQLLYNNHPDDLRLWLVEPKNEMHAFMHAEHVTRFMDPLVSTFKQHALFAALLEEAVTEMRRRYTEFASHPARPQKLSEARELARVDPTAAHLNFPYLIIVVEECATYFVPPLPDEREDHARVMRYAIQLARESRAAGIHMVFATQYPSKQSIPTTLKQQCRRIGLSCADLNASYVVLDQGGLEEVSGPGRGLIREGKDCIPMRGLLLVREGDRDDRADIIDQIPENDIWPKLPTVAPASDTVEVVGDAIEDPAPPTPPVVVAVDSLGDDDDDDDDDLLDDDEVFDFGEEDVWTEEARGPDHMVSTPAANLQALAEGMADSATDATQPAAVAASAEGPVADPAVVAPLEPASTAPAAPPEPVAEPVAPIAPLEPVAAAAPVVVPINDSGAETLAVEQPASAPQAVAPAEAIPNLPEAEEERPPAPDMAPPADLSVFLP